ncbi:MAG TPA: RNA-binding protein [Anaerolineales bacterium]|nr:RNA-binding protein [Anaerolineales bacterium]
METKLYVGNLAYSTAEADLRSLFAQAGTVTDVALIKDRNSGQSKGFGFVTMSNQAETQQAIRLFNGKEVDGRPLTVNLAKPREENGGQRGGGNRRF